MSKKRSLNALEVAAGLFFLGGAPGLTRAHSGPSGPAQTSKATSSGGQQTKDRYPTEDFAGLQYTDEQKAEIEKIHRETKSRMDAVNKDEKLSADQKDALLLGYTRMEYHWIYKLLTPEQQLQVRDKVRTRRAAEQAGQKKPSP